MAVKKPMRSGVKIPRTDLPSVMTHQNKQSGDSRAVRTSRISWTTTPDIAKILEEEAYLRRMPKSQLIELAVRSYLNIKI